MVHSLLPRLQSKLFKKKKKSNNLIWWYHRRSGIAMLPPTSSKWFQVVASGLGGMQGLEWTDKPAQKHSFPESLSLTMREKHKSK